MSARFIAVCFSVFFVVACSGSSSHETASQLDDPAASSGDTDTPSETQSGAPGECGMSTTDWCPAVDGDPCGAYTDVQSCRANTRCEGVPYRGESLVACQLDARCFAHNCPTVGCVSRCETLDEQGCGRQGYRCSWNGATCDRSDPCGAPEGK